MDEALFQFIWQHQYFHWQHLTTLQGEPVQVVHPGIINHNQGPDFLNARIRVGNTLLAGHVELHIQSSDWLLHGHSADPNYRNVILHVVWQQDRSINLPIPVIELRDRVSKLMLDTYRKLATENRQLPCTSVWPSLQPLIITGWMERLMAERLLSKGQRFLKMVHESEANWETAFWWLLARSFGGPVNADVFESVARSVPVQLLHRHAGQIHQIEAILLGQAGLLNDQLDDDYPQLLQREYQYLKRKYALNPVPVVPSFLRMRPAAFPGLRLAQLAMCLHSGNLSFSRILQGDSIEIISDYFRVTANDYWHYHYHFQQAGTFLPKKAGLSLIRQILINAVIPAVFCFGDYRNEPFYSTKALNWLQSLPPESLKEISCFDAMIPQLEHAGHSQALLHLHQAYCSQHHCLSCAIGMQMLKKTVN